MKLNRLGYPTTTRGCKRDQRRIVLRVLDLRCNSIVGHRAKLLIYKLRLRGEHFQWVYLLHIGVPERIGFGIVLVFDGRVILIGDNAINPPMTPSVIQTQRRDSRGCGCNGTCSRTGGGGAAYNGCCCS
jgi:hypothetical protein